MNLNWGWHGGRGLHTIQARAVNSNCQPGNCISGLYTLRTSYTGAYSWQYEHLQQNWGINREWLSTASPLHPSTTKLPRLQRL